MTTENQPDRLAAIEQKIESLMNCIKAMSVGSTERLAYSEPEAAKLLGLQRHQLRDERLKGRISASQIVRGRIRYLKQDLADYLGRSRFEVRI